MALESKQRGRRSFQSRRRNAAKRTPKKITSPPEHEKEDASQIFQKNDDLSLEETVSDYEERLKSFETAAGPSGTASLSRTGNSGEGESSRGSTAQPVQSAMEREESDSDDFDSDNDSFPQFVIDSKPDRRLSINTADGNILLADDDSEPKSDSGDDNDSVAGMSDDEGLMFKIDKVGSFVRNVDARPTRGKKGSETGHTEEQDGSQKTKSIKLNKREEIADGIEKAQTDTVTSIAESGAVSFEAPCEIDAGLDLGDCYVDLEEDPTSSKKNVENILLESQRDKLISKSVITPDFEKKHSIPPYKTALSQLKKQRKKERESSMGAGWFGMKAAEMTDELRNDIKVIRMRSTLDPKRFYKGNDMTGIPKFVQVGTVVDSPVDFYHSRVPRKQRKQTVVDELLADADARRYNKRKYMELQDRFNSSTRGGKKHKFGKKSNGKRR